MVTETNPHDADNMRVRGTTTAFYMNGLYEEEAGGTTRRHYTFGGKVVARASG